MEQLISDISAPSYDDGDGSVGRSRSIHPGDDVRTAYPPNRMKPLPESLIFDMRYFPFKSIVFTSRK